MIGAVTHTTSPTDAPDTYTHPLRVAVHQPDPHVGVRQQSADLSLAIVTCVP